MKASILAFGAIALAGPALASPCGDEIAQLQARYDAAPPVAGAQSPPVTAGAVSTQAKLHHQPAPANNADANVAADSPASRRDAQFKVAIEEARAADHDGDAATCEAAAARAQAALSH